MKKNRRTAIGITMREMRTLEESSTQSIRRYC